MQDERREARDGSYLKCPMIASCILYGAGVPSSFITLYPRLTDSAMTGSVRSWYSFNRCLMTSVVSSTRCSTAPPQNGQVVGLCSISSNGFLHTEQIVRCVLRWTVVSSGICR